MNRDDKIRKAGAEEHSIYVIKECRFSLDIH